MKIEIHKRQRSLRTNACSGEIGGAMTAEQEVKAKWPDATLMKAFAKQKDGLKRWMWCAESNLAFLSRRGQRNRVTNIGAWQYSEVEAWADAASRLRAGRESG